MKTVIFPHAFILYIYANVLVCGCYLFGFYEFCAGHMVIGKHFIDL